MNAESITRSIALSLSADRKLDELAAYHGVSRSAIFSQLLLKANFAEIPSDVSPKAMRSYELPQYAIERLRALAEEYEVSQATIIEEICLTQLESD